MAKLIILVGLPGSGKSYYAERLWSAEVTFTESAAVIHSSDAIRKELFGDEGSQENNSLVFETMHKRVKEDLRAGKTVIYDATNITRKSRRGAIALADKIRDSVEVHIVWAPIKTCIERDAQRERKVGAAVIDKMLRRWQSPSPTIEGFDELKLVCTDSTFDQVDYISRKTAEMHLPHDNPHHTLDIYHHCLEAALHISKIEESAPDELKVAAYWHDIGKPYTKFYKKDKETGEIDYSKAHYYDHQNVGAYLAYGLFINNSYLKSSVVEKACWISWLINNHMEPFFDSKFYKELPTWEKHCIDVLHKADLEAH